MCRYGTVKLIFNRPFRIRRVERGKSCADMIQAMKKGRNQTKNENNNEAAMGNQWLTVSAITKNNGQSDSGGEGGEWKRKLCVCVVLVQQFFT